MSMQVLFGERNLDLQYDLQLLISQPLSAFCYAKLRACMATLWIEARSILSSHISHKVCEEKRQATRKELYSTSKKPHLEKEEGRLDSALWKLVRVLLKAKPKPALLQ